MNGWLKKIAGKNGESAVFDAAEMNRALARMEGVGPVFLKNSSERVIKGPIAISRIDKFPLLAFENSNSGGYVSITLDRKTSAEALSLLSPDLVDYLSSLAAPLATGEELGKAEYLELVASIYGKALAAEIASAWFTLTLELPGPISAVQGGTRNKSNKAEFKIPLVDILVLEKTLVYEARWVFGAQ